MVALNNEKPIKQSGLVENNMLVTRNSILIFEGCYQFVNWRKNCLEKINLTSPKIKTKES